jgi:hypothetical protein
MCRRTDPAWCRSPHSHRPSRSAWRQPRLTGRRFTSEPHATPTASPAVSKLAGRIGVLGRTPRVGFNDAPRRPRGRRPIHSLGSPDRAALNQPSPSRATPAALTRGNGKAPPPPRPGLATTCRPARAPGRRARAESRDRTGAVLHRVTTTQDRSIATTRRPVKQTSTQPGVRWRRSPWRVCRLDP